MHVTTLEAARTTTTDAAVMTTLASPSLGSSELCTWRVDMAADATGPVHAIDREQVWLPTSGTLEITVNGLVRTASAGEAAILPAGVQRQVRAVGGPAQALVCMPAGGVASVPGRPDTVALPWAQ